MDDYYHHYDTPNPDPDYYEPFTPHPDDVLYPEDLAELECPCPHHQVIAANLGPHPTPLELLIYMAHYQYAGDCCRETSTCRVDGCWQEDFDHFDTMQVPFCVDHFNQIVLDVEDLDCWDVYDLPDDVEQAVISLNEALTENRAGGGEDDC